MRKSTKSKRPAQSRRTALAIGCVYYYVADMDRAVRFYTRVLGLPLVVRYDDFWAEVDAGSTRIGLHPTDGGKRVKPGGGGGTVSFYVDDVKALMRKLKKAGATVAMIAESERGPMALVHDPDGNWLHFSEFNPAWVKQAKYPLPKRRK